jgi:cobalt/nickel transport system permease protein
MHIPDGYLSPTTCATLYGLSLGGWYAALKRVKLALAAKTVPLISVMASFCFVVMMFNVPLPGGTTGHAVGIAVAAIVLGPWGSILSLSIAITLQALFFGDGGITTLGANCFNMAIAGSLVASAVYRMLARGSDFTARRRAVAAAIAGYVSINVAALLAATEFGIQPLLFHDAAGTPLYAPYPLRVAIPAMMIGHLTIAGLAEAAIAAGMVSYLQKVDIGLLRGIDATASPCSGTVPASRTAGATRLWWIVAGLMVCTPLGVLATGAAWGDWQAAELQHRLAADERSPASGAAASGTLPAGLQKLSGLWTAPFPAYAPRFLRHPTTGYLLSAMFGVGILMSASLVAAARSKRQSSP